MKNKMRDSNYELLRITSMFMIVLWHLIGRVINNTNGLLFVILKVFQALLVVHVNSFILVSGYYQCKSKFKFSKVVSLNNASWFYRAATMILLIFLNIISVNKIDFLMNIFPLDLGFYWFIDIYLVLYCISPFLNILIDKMGQSNHKKLLVTMFLLISILPTFTNQLTYFNKSGYSLINFIMLYFIGAYFRKYRIEIWDYFKISSNEMKKLIYSICFVILAVFNVTLYFFGDHIINLGKISYAIGNTLVSAFISYDNPLVIIGAIMYFLWFGCLTIKSRFINKIGSLTFGVYLLHEAPFFRQHLYNFLGFREGIPIDSYMVIPKVIAYAVIIFSACLIIECIRQVLFQFISRLRFSQKIKNKWYRYIETLKSS